ncbi:hypothetical protein GA0070615_6313 [Micromonospora aurantiaca]|nr:hypothetical protein GA0070615_6313 [Micromonospora aurantiaca]
MIRFAVTRRRARRDRAVALGRVARSSRTRTASALEGKVGAAAAHGDAEIGGGEGGCVVDAVADEQHPPAAGLYGAHLVDLVLRQQPGVHVGDPGLRRQVPGGAGVVTGEQHRPGPGEAGQRDDGVGADPVGQGKHPDGRPVDDHHHGGVAGGLRVGGHGPGLGHGHGRELVEQDRPAHGHLPAVDHRAYAPAGHGREVGRRRHRQPVVLRRREDRGTDGVFAWRARPRRQAATPPPGGRRRWGGCRRRGDGLR